MKQLSESVKAVYGSGFDGYRYLKRFFDVEFSLPNHRGTAFADLLLADYMASLRKPIQCGIPPRASQPTGQPEAFLLEWVAETFDLDLRAQRQILEMATAAAAGIPKGRPVHLMWLLALCTLQHRGPDYLDRVLALRDDDSSGLYAIFEQAGATLVPRKTTRTDSHGREKEVDVMLREACAV